MKLYLDDDSADALLVALLIRDGHDCQTPMDAGMVGQDDPVHLMHAAREDRALLRRGARHSRLRHGLEGKKYESR